MCFMLSCLLRFISASNPLHLVTLNSASSSRYALEQETHRSPATFGDHGYSASTSLCMDTLHYQDVFLVSNTQARQATMHSVGLVVTTASTSRTLQPPTAAAYKPDTVLADNTVPADTTSRLTTPSRLTPRPG